MVEGNNKFAHRRTAQTGDTTLVVRDVHASYGRKPVLRGVSLRVERGEIAVLLGPNGSGKSTILRVVAGLLQQSGGSVVLCGQVLDHMPVHARMRLGMGYFLQGGQVFPDMTTEENLSIGWRAAGRAYRWSGASEALDLFPDLQRRLRVRAGLLSGGEKQQLAVAMVLAQRPRVLLLDEPSAGMAPALADQLLQQIAGAVGALGLAVLLVEQRVTQALAVSQRVYGLKLGRIVLDSAPECLHETDALQQLFLH